MYNFNGFIPVVRCVCGEEIELRRATVCKCGATIRIRARGGSAHPYGIAPDNYDLKARPHKLIEVICWQPIEAQSC